MRVHLVLLVGGGREGRVSAGEQRKRRGMRGDNGHGIDARGDEKGDVD